jgi:glycine hydroxymethyltransferase
MPNTIPHTLDPILKTLIHNERERQEHQITLIASENYISPSLLKLYGYSLPLTNKYAEGYPSRRYYGGCHIVDEIETLAIERAKALFGVDYANVQPHSGSQANAAALMALLQPGDCLLSMKLAHGGHLTHGAPVNFSGKFYHAVYYGVDENGLIDYDQVERLAKTHRPKVIIAGYSAYSRQIDWQRFRHIADHIQAYLIADIAHIAGLVAAGLHPSPVPFADIITTTTHKTLRGPRGGMILARDAQFAKAKKLNSCVFPGLQGGPLMHVIAAKAAAFHEALQPEFKHYQANIIENAKAMAETLQSRGFNIISGGTDTHLFLVDLRNYGLSGQAAETLLEKAHIILNKNMLPYDTQPASITSGLRIGTPAITTRGCKKEEAQQIAHWIADLLLSSDQSAQIVRIKEEVVSFCQKFPIYHSYSK